MTERLDTIAVLLLEVFHCSWFVTARFVSHRPHDHCWPVFISADQFSHDFIVMVQIVFLQINARKKKALNELF